MHATIGTTMESIPQSTSPVLFVGIVLGWLIISLAMGAKKAYFDPWDNIPEDTVDAK
ncbi:MAG TPA: hypothetical protein V6D17_06780 [Candidatus Obscuribacterales bacterium]